MKHTPWRRMFRRNCKPRLTITSSCRPYYFIANYKKKHRKTVTPKTLEKLCWRMLLWGACGCRCLSGRQTCLQCSKSQWFVLCPPIELINASQQVEVRWKGTISTEITVWIRQFGHNWKQFRQAHCMRECCTTKARAAVRIIVFKFGCRPDVMNSPHRDFCRNTCVKTISWKSCVRWNRMLRIRRSTQERSHILPSRNFIRFIFSSPVCCDCHAGSEKVKKK